MKYPRKIALKVGVGMVPRGEMGLIIASMVIASGYINDIAYSIAVMVVALTTLIALPILKKFIKIIYSYNFFSKCCVCYCTMLQLIIFINISF